MQYAMAENGDVRISRLGLGGNIFGYACDARETERLIGEAWNQGVNFIDTADTYGAGISESYIGNALQHRRHGWFLATKAGIQSGEEPHGFATASNLRRKLEGSLRRLGTDYIDLYQLHHYDPKTRLSDTLGALEGFRREGKIRHFGVSNYSAAALSECSAACDALQISRPSTLQCAYNVFVRNAEAELFDQCGRYGIGILAFGVLARGLLGGRYQTREGIPENSRAARSDSIRGDIDEDILLKLREMETIAARHSVGIAQAALLWALRPSVVAAAVVGVRTEPQLQDLCAAFDVDLEPEFFSGIDALMEYSSAGGSLKFGAQRLFG